jgi:FAD/FMN-containing dehydrogenase
MSYRIERLNGSITTLPDEEAGELAMTFHGDLLGPDEPGYEEARVVQNGMIDRRPGLIIRCSGTADVMDAVDLARDRGLKTSVRGGGHSVAGHCICDDGLMIDLSEMRGVWVDPDARRVRVQAGATWGDVDRETQKFGLAVPGGVVSTTGVAGLTLGGGIGWLHRKHGLACDNLRSVELVTPDGELVRASEDENEELFWGLRGGGGNFGVVTTFEFEAHPLGPIVMCGAPFYPIAAADEVFPRWRDWAATVPEEVTSRALFWSMPEHELLPPAVWNEDVLLLGALYAGPAEEGEEVLQPIREFGRPLSDLSGPMPYRTFQSMLDPFFPKGELSSYWKSTYLGELTDGALEYIRRRSRNRPNGDTLVHVPMMGGAASRPGPDETAFGDRSAEYMLSVDGNWTDPAEAERVIAWVREAIRGAEELETGGGTYLNFSGDDPQESAEAVEAAYGQNLQRLRKLKGRYDPKNLFRLNNNIVPAP